ncbi:MAG: GyrI-like domain-containing protein, partial [Acidobacteria bacterium]|nr:GyrI-like domain-containing protein [Acidobacteriota bacterium]
GFIHENGLTQAGAPLAIAEFWGEGGYRFEAAIPLASDPGLEMAESSAVNVRQMAGARAVRLVHVGPYTGLVDSYLALEAYMAARGMTPSGYSWEEYISDPGSTPEDQLVTHIFMPIGS